MGGELGNETYIDLLLVLSALSPPNLILIENDSFHTNLVSKSWCFWVFADISARSSRKKKKWLEFFMYVFFSHNQRCVSVSASNFCSPIYSSGSRDTALGSFLNAGPARTLYSKSLTAAVEVTSTIWGVISYFRMARFLPHQRAPLARWPLSVCLSERLLITCWWVFFSFSLIGARNHQVFYILP